MYAAWAEEETKKWEAMEPPHSKARTSETPSASAKEETKGPEAMEPPHSKARTSEAPPSCGLHAA